MKAYLFHSLICACILSLFAGCAVGPGYEVTETDTQLGFETRSGNLDIASVQWWQQFDDPVLQSLLESALENNLQLDVARHRWAKSLLMVNQMGASRKPRVDLDVSLMTQERSENGMFPVVEGFPGFPDRTETLAHGGLQLAWELDLYGRIGAQVEVAEQGALMAELGLKDGWRLILSETGRNYLQYVTYAEQITFLETQIESGQKILSMDERRLEFGAVPQSKVDADRVLVKRLQSALPGLQHQREAALIRLSVLTTLDVENLRVRLAQAHVTGENGNPLSDVTIDTDHLLTRPDLRLARASLDQSLARHKIAVSNLYPCIVLLGGLGLESIESGELLSAASRFWNLGPAVSLPVFNGGQLRSQVEVELEEVKVRVSEFRAVYLNAVAEVQMALHQYQTAFNSMEVYEELLDSLEQQYETVKIQNQAGLVSYSELLQAEMELITAKSEWIQKKAAIRIGLINLCQAVGGSWGD